MQAVKAVILLDVGNGDRAPLRHAAGGLGPVRRHVTSSGEPVEVPVAVEIKVTLAPPKHLQVKRLERLGAAELLGEFCVR